MLQIIRESKYEHIENFVLYGERHSGTKFLQQSLECYNITPTGYFGNKHWMGYANANRIKFARHTLFICIIRNPYQWLSAFMNNPHHVPRHNRKWQSFLTNEWYSIGNNKEEILHDRNFYDITNNRYRNVIHLRNTKNQYMFYDLPLIAKNYVFVTYETLIKNHIQIMNLIRDKFMLQQKSNLPTANHPILRKVPSVHMDFVNSNLNWEIENGMGFYKE